MSKTQLEFLKEIISLKEQHPDYEIHFCVSSDEILDDCHWTAHKIREIKICPWFVDDERIFTDEDEIRDYFEDIYCDDDISDEELEKKVDEECKKIEMAICVFTYA